METVKITDKPLIESPIKLYLYDVSGSLSDSEQLKKLREKCLNSTHPLRFIQLSIDEKCWMNERDYYRSLNCH